MTDPTPEESGISIAVDAERIYSTFAGREPEGYDAALAEYAADEIRAAVQAENKKLCRINDTWDGVAASLGQIGFAIGVLDPRGESQGGLEALMYGLSAAIRDRGGVES